jgi:hypothetical protein
MKKKIEDYLHLYLGCRIKSKGGKLGDLVSVSTDGMSIVVYDKDKINDPRGLCINSEWLLPILRPLSDMTEQEAYDLERLGHECVISKVSTYQFYAERTKYILSKHFDLFGLIEAGLAVNAAELKSVSSR